MRRGIDQRQEVDPGLLLRDTRTIWQRIADFFKEPGYVALALIAIAGFSFFYSGVADILFILGIIFFLIAITRKPTLPFRMPMRAGIKDYNDIKPGTREPYLSRGIAYFGNHIDTNEELWFNNEDMRTHVLIFGSTGSGKTEALDLSCL